MFIFDLLKYGMGKFRIIENGIRLEGEVEFLDSLYINKIQLVQVYVKDILIYIDIYIYINCIVLIFIDRIKGFLQDFMNFIFYDRSLFIIW